MDSLYLNSILSRPQGSAVIIATVRCKLPEASYHYDFKHRAEIVEFGFKWNEITYTIFMFNW